MKQSICNLSASPSAATNIFTIRAACYNPHQTMHTVALMHYLLPLRVFPLIGLAGCKTDRPSEQGSQRISVARVPNHARHIFAHHSYTSVRAQV